jgi:hypothetical protein
MLKNQSLLLPHSVNYFQVNFIMHGFHSTDPCFSDIAVSPVMISVQKKELRTVSLHWRCVQFKNIFNILTYLKTKLTS